jgi:hypothetical protein
MAQEAITPLLHYSVPQKETRLFAEAEEARVTQLD